ncbi:AmmeMemoRadiSam system radical SAM enzyme [candidate division KSB1 bacterium]|nr:AmmeMemoRadiSam system radical SAM enzyme [candidate division KSB1 bacterium]
MKSRRRFIKNTSMICLGAGLVPNELFVSSASAATGAGELLTEARYYDKLAHRKIKCVLCPRECVIDDLERGYCGVRENRGGTYYTLVHSRPCTAHIDPIEKKPLFHFMPASMAFSIATVGCNVECKFCQNWQISQVRPEQIRNYDMPPEVIAEYAKEKKCKSIAYTYTEPVIFTEYMYDCAVAGNERDVASVMISNGYINPKPMKDLSKVLRAVKIDLKAFTEKFYRNLVAGELKPVLDTLVLLREMDIWTEIVYLVIPSHNDDPNELKQMCQWIVSELGADVPVHFTRFYPQYRLKNLPPTPISTLESTRKIAQDAGINFCYIGNVPQHGGENTYCPSCNKMLIKRRGYIILENNITGNRCANCQQEIPGIWS